MSRLSALSKDIVECRQCPRLVEWREQVAREKRRAYREQTYWGRPVPGFGDPRARLVIVGLAPAAHGANRTGRMFTGDRSGDFLYAGLHRAGFASQPTSVAKGDGLTLGGAYVLAPVRCAPPDNWPSSDEVRTCRPFFHRELALLKPRVLLALGALAFDQVLEALQWERPRPRFAHGTLLQREAFPSVLGCYHVSQQNTQTGRLTARMFDAILRQAQALLDG